MPDKTRFKVISGVSAFFMELVSELQDFFFFFHLEILTINTRGGSSGKSKYATFQKLNLGSGEFGNRFFKFFLNLKSSKFWTWVVEFNELQKNSLIPFK